MSPVFRHGGLRLYLLKLLDEAPRHGYDVIRLLQDRFLGVYSPSPGTIYPRLARLEEEGLVTHDVVDGKKVYKITDAGREELNGRLDDLADLEDELAASVRDIAREISRDVRETVRNLRDEFTWAVREAGRGGADPGRRDRPTRASASAAADQREAEAQQARADAEQAQGRADHAQARADQAHASAEQFRVSARTDADADQAQAEADQAQAEADREQARADQARARADEAQARVAEARAEVDEARARADEAAARADEAARADIDQAQAEKTAEADEAETGQAAGSGAAEAGAAEAAAANAAAGATAPGEAAQDADAQDAGTRAESVWSTAAGESVRGAEQASEAGPGPEDAGGGRAGWAREPSAALAVRGLAGMGRLGRTP